MKNSLKLIAALGLIISGSSLLEAEHNGRRVKSGTVIGSHGSVDAYSDVDDNYLDIDNNNNRRRVKSGTVIGSHGSVDAYSDVDDTMANDGNNN